MGADGGRKRVDDSRQTPPGPLPIERAVLLTRRDEEYTMPAADRSRWAQARARGLDPWREHYACGAGFVARASGHPSSDIAPLGRQALARGSPPVARATVLHGHGA